MLLVRAWTRCTVDEVKLEGMAPKLNNPQDVMLLTGMTQAGLGFCPTGKQITFSCGGWYLFVAIVLISEVGRADKDRVPRTD